MTKRLSVAEKLKVVQDKNRELGKLLKALREANQDLQQENKGFLTSKDDLENQVDNLRRERDGLSEDLDESTSKVQELGEERGRLFEEVVEKSVRIQELNKENYQIRDVGFLLARLILMSGKGERSELIRFVGLLKEVGVAESDETVITAIHFLSQAAILCLSEKLKVEPENNGEENHPEAPNPVNLGICCC